MERQKKTGFFSKLKRVIAGRKKVDDDFLDSVEEVLLTSDVGLDTTVKIVEAIEQKAEASRASTEDELMAIVKDSVSSVFDHQETYDSNRFLPSDRPSPYVLMVVGVNGVGKTTTIGKLAYRLQKQGWITKIHKGNGRLGDHNKYTVSSKGHRLINRIYKILIGKETLPESTRRSKIMQRKTYVDKVYSQAIKKFNKENLNG